MPLDAVCLQAVLEELRPRLLGLRIDKVQQPARDQVVLLLRGNQRLLLNAGANAPRIQLTKLTRDNPAEPPMFCMLLRKHLVGARVTDLVQPPLERLVRLELDVTDDFGQPGKRTLVLEAMGRRSNLILLDGEGRVIDCLRRVDADMSAARQVLPGLYYEPPASTGRLPVTEETEAGFREKLAAANPERQLDAFLLDSYFGVSPIIARELAFRTAGETDRHIFELRKEQEDRFWAELQGFIDTIRENRFTPICLRQDGKPVDFSYLPITQYGGAVETERYGSFCELLDDFYEARERMERINRMPGIRCYKPQATFVLFPDVTGTGMDPVDLVAYLEKEHKLSIVPGGARFFGPGSAGHVRICLATSHEVLAEGLNRLEAGLQAIAAQKK